MKDRLDIRFHTKGLANIAVSINSCHKYNGKVSDISLPFEMCQHNQLQIDFLQVKENIEIISICYNHLSIEHFIYQGYFSALDSENKIYTTNIDSKGSWVYCFDSDLAKQIIKANT